MEKAKRIIGILLVIIGVSLIISVGYKKYITAKKNNELIEDFRETIGTKEDENKVNNENEKEDEKEEIDMDEISAIAIMEIPSIKLTQGVVEGIGDNVLQYYLGHFPESVKPGEAGNFAVAGHRVSEYTDAFVNLYKIKIGDDIIITTRDKKLTYEVDDMFIVKPDEVYVLDQTEEPTITLVTCTVGAKERVIVKGKLKTVDEL